MQNEKRKDQPFDANAFLSPAGENCRYRPLVEEAVFPDLLRSKKIAEQRGELPAEFEKAIFMLTPGSSSKIVSTKYGYHIFGVQQRIPAHQQKFIEVHDRIREKLLLEREREIMDSELASLRESIPVVIHRESLDFNYQAPRHSGGEGSIQ